MIESINNRILCAPYLKKDAGIETEKKVTGFSGIRQKNSLSKLEVLQDACFVQGTFIRSIKKGDFVFIEEEILFGHAWSSKTYSCDLVEKPFILVDASYVVLHESKEG